MTAAHGAAPAGRGLDVLVVGDLNPDLLLAGDVVPRFGQVEQLLTQATVELAGSGGIVAAGTARLGLRTGIAAHVGRDAFGDLVLARLADRDVDTHLVTRVEGAPTGLTVVLDAGGDRALLTHPGAMAAEDGARVTDAVLAGVRHVHLAGWFLLPWLAAAGADLLRRARAAGCSTSLDTNWDPAGSWAGVLDVLPHVDLFLPNEAELGALVPGVGADAAAARLRERSPGTTLVLKRGAAGASAWGPDGVRHDAAPVPVQPVDTTGAGDGFDAGLLAGLLTGLDLPGALRLACAAGALSTRARGGTPAQITRAEADALAAREPA